MIGLFKMRAVLLIFCIVGIGMLATVSNAQVYTKPVNPKATPTPLYQPIIIQPSVNGTGSPTTLINKTSSVTARMPDDVNPSATEMAIPGYSGILIETLDGRVIKESYSNYAFNPASNVKVATAFAVLKTFGPNYRFPTNVFTDGTVDETTGTLNGNLYISGRDPNFTYEHAVAIALTLNKLGIRQVLGDLIVNDSFVMALNGSYRRSAEILFATLDMNTRPSAATRAWRDYMVTSARPEPVTGVPSVNFSGKLYVDMMPSNAKLLFAHESAPLKEIVKITLCYSNNFLAEKLGNMVGGPYAVARIVQVNTGVTAAEFALQTSSGLGINRVTPHAHMRLLRAFRNELARYKLTFADVMPIAGLDPGTLQKRFKNSASIVGKTGTLGNTDGGVSSLSGEMQTKNGKLLFVIFNQRGSTNRFRNFQDDYVNMVQNQLGGSASLGYSTLNLSSRMANTRIVYPKNGMAAN